MGQGTAHMSEGPSSTSGSMGPIVVVADVFPQFSQTFVVDHIRGLAVYGWEVHVAARQVDHDALAALDLPSGVTVHALRAPRRTQPLQRVMALGPAATPARLPLLRSVSFRSALYFARDLRSLVARCRPRVVHAHFAHNGLLASLAASRQAPVVVTFHGYDVLELPLREGWAPFRALLDGCHGVVHSTFLEEHVGRHLAAPLHRVTLGVDGELFRGTQRRSTWQHPLRLLTVGRLVPQKGHHVAIEALARLRQRVPELNPNLTVIGDGAEHERLVALARRSEVDKHVRFLGPQPPEEVARVMASSDILLIPSIVLGGWQESFCRVAVEGMASGMAVIGTSRGGLAETIGHGGFVVEPDDGEALANTILSVLQDERPADVAERACARAADFSSEAMWKEYHELADVVSHGGDGL